MLDVSQCTLGKVPRFGGNVLVNMDGNLDIGRDGPPGLDSPNFGNADDGGKKKSIAVILGSIVAVPCGVLLASILDFCYCKRKKQRKV